MCCSSAAQQEAQRAQFYVEKAKQDQRQKIIQAEGEAEAAKMVSWVQLLWNVTVIDQSRLNNSRTEEEEVLRSLASVKVQLKDGPD